MIYELSLVAKSQLSDDQVKALQSIISETVTADAGEVLLEDDWGVRTLAQATNTGITNARMLYFIYRTDSSTTNTELARRFRISEDVIKSMVIVLGDNTTQEASLKNYKCPYSKTNPGSVTDEVEEGEMGKDRRRFSKRKNCWFAAKQISPDWKDPKTYSWLVNEFGKISPARISGISRKSQRFATTAIKRARQVGVASYLSNRMAE